MGTTRGRGFSGVWGGPPQSSRSQQVGRASRAAVTARSDACLSIRCGLISGALPERLPLPDEGPWPY
eukprot:5609700-Prymnesium_polylepis.1